MMNVTQYEGLSIHVDQLNDELNDHWTQTEGEKKKKKKKKNIYIYIFSEVAIRNLKNWGFSPKVWTTNFFSVQRGTNTRL